MPGSSSGGTWYATLRRKSRRVRAGLKPAASQASLTSVVGQAMWLWGQGQPRPPAALQPGPSVVWRAAGDDRGQAHRRSLAVGGPRRSRSEMDISRLQVGAERGRSGAEWCRAVLRGAGWCRVVQGGRGGGAGGEEAGEGVGAGDVGRSGVTAGSVLSDIGT